MNIPYTNRLAVMLLIGIGLVGRPAPCLAQENHVIKKRLEMHAQKAREHEAQLTLLPIEQEQERGNAVPVLLRMVYEQQAWMKEVYPKLHEYAEMEISNPRLQELNFDSFARQAIRAGSMNDAVWEYPLQSENPYMILLPDLQSQRQLMGRGMTGWIKQQLAKGDLNQALVGIKAQLGCARHCAATPVAVCHLVGLAIANLGLDNLELAMQSSDCPNLYWSLASLPPTLHDPGPMVRWELWAAPARLAEPLPKIGSQEWVAIAEKFLERLRNVDASALEKTTDELQSKILPLAKKQLPAVFGFSEAEMERMSSEELGMRWVYMKYCSLRTRIEPLAFQSPSRVIAAQQEIDEMHQAMRKEIGLESSLHTVALPVKLPLAILAARSFERRVKFLQTIEALRDHAEKHAGKFPKTLAELELPAPDDPYTRKPFVYELDGTTARLRQEPIQEQIEGNYQSHFDYELSITR